MKSSFWLIQRESSYGRIAGAVGMEMVKRKWRLGIAADRNDPWQKAMARCAILVVVAVSTLGR